MQALISMINIVWGTKLDKTQSSRALAEALSSDETLQGYLYIGYPVVGSPMGPVSFDALLLTKQHGIVAFDLIEATELGQYKARQDDIATMLEVKLKPYAALKKGRSLAVEINTFSFAPAKTIIPPREGEYVVTNLHNLIEELATCGGIDDEVLFSNLLAAVQVVTSIRAGQQKRTPQKLDSRNARLKRIEDSIANLDQQQSKAVIETVEGVQRIRGLAGSGKTIVLALKVAYLHSQNPDWNIAVTFNTRSLKEQFRRLITNFTIEQTGMEPYWDQIDIINAWGAPGDRDRDGIYHKFSRETGLPFYDFATAKQRFGSSDNAFSGACSELLRHDPRPKNVYDLILIDEAQDFPPEFFRLCYRYLCEPKRLVYAYDELQSLTGTSVLPPEELFGADATGQPLVSFSTPSFAAPKQDIILEKCYRNSRPVLATAHALGFGIYRREGLVQFFDQDSLWADVGYSIVDGTLEPGEEVSLARTLDSSPEFLESHSSIDDLISFIRFESTTDQANWLVNSISNDLTNEELRPEDIVVINPDPIRTNQAVGLPRKLLYERGVSSELAGISTSRDIFSRAGSITFTGIFRAKGNEAGMVYIINAHDCATDKDPASLARIRNQLFTAITRSKAWVRVLGVGPKMDILIDEWNLLKSNNYQLRFTYPDPPTKAKLRLINVQTKSPRPIQSRQIDLHRRKLIKAVKMGLIDPKQLIADLQSAQEDIQDK
jgi:superfamily I DNA and RNA helicase